MSFASNINEVPLKLPLDWEQFLDGTTESLLGDTYYTIKQEYSSNTVFPPYKQILQSFNITRVNDLKCVIIGQDPYHGEGQAHGLAFSVLNSKKSPPSLVNILKELDDDLNLKFNPSFNGNLTPWAQQGVLLLNRILTVEAGKPLSHSHLGWQQFTHKVVKTIAQQKPHVVFILLGTAAQELKKDILQFSDSWICAPHPSPLSAYRGFFGSKIFSKTNELLIKNKQRPIDWTL